MSIIISVSKVKRQIISVYGEDVVKIKSDKIIIKEGRKNHDEEKKDNCVTEEFMSCYFM